MGVQTTREVVDAWHDARERHDVDAIRALLAPDFEWHLPPSAFHLLADKLQWHESATALDPVVIGPDAAAESLAGEEHKSWLKLETQHREIRRLIVDGDTACAQLRMTAERLDGSMYANDYVFIYVVRDGLLAELHAMLDTLSAARQFDLPH
jgi:ketosteroid isomerase-like protein